MSCSIIFINIYLFGVSNGVMTKNEGLCGSNMFYGNSICHGVKASNDLPSGDKRKFPENSIFFIETTCKGGLDFEEACSVESAARHHPHRQINVLFAGPVAIQCLSSRPLSAVLAYRNVRLLRIHPTDFIRDTPLEYWLTKPLRTSYFPIKHTLDMLKLLILFKSGGIYLNLNMITVKNFDLLPIADNWVVKKWPDILGEEAMALSNNEIGRKVINTTLLILRDNFNPIDWSYNSIDILKKALKSVCVKNKLKVMSPATCHGFGIYPSNLFYPLRGNIRNLQHYAQPGFHSYLNATSAYAFLLWNQMTTHQKRHEAALFSRILGRFCPEVNRHLNLRFHSELSKREMNLKTNNSRSLRSACYCQ